MNLSPEQIKFFWERVDQTGGPDECWNWTKSCYASGYGAVTYNYFTHHANNLALRLGTGPPPDNLRKNALHKCKLSRKCCNPAHLYWGTHKENGEDKVKDGTSARGETNGDSKLTEEQVLEIRKKYVPRKYPLTKLAKEYKVAKSTILKIVNRKTWTHI